MKEQIPQPTAESRTLQGKNREANTASVTNVLQAYKNGIFQRQEVNEDELLQRKFETSKRNEPENYAFLQGKLIEIPQERVAQMAKHNVFNGQGRIAGKAYSRIESTKNNFRNKVVTAKNIKKNDPYLSFAQGNGRTPKLKRNEQGIWIISGGDKDVRTKFMRLHLLNAEMGGKPIAENLVLGTYALNAKHKNLVETPLKQKLNDGHEIKRYTITAELETIGHLEVARGLHCYAVFKDPSVEPINVYIGCPKLNPENKPDE